MLAAVQNYIPVITSEAGLCLTAENWQEAKVTTVSYSLASLLHKPGLAVLNKIADLSHYLGWSGTLVLNAMMLVANKEGNYILRSPYDGSKIEISATDLIALIQHLKPDAAILPKNILHDCPKIWDKWTNSIVPFIYADDLPVQELTRTHGVYFSYINGSKLDELGRWAHVPRYITGAIDVELMQRVRDKGVNFIETDVPANDAIHGKVYSQTGTVDLTDSAAQMQFEVIDADCACPTCAQKFTKAYFYHLLQHTPLLCHRLLIQHNVFWLAKSEELVDSI